MLNVISTVIGKSVRTGGPSGAFEDVEDANEPKTSYS